MNTKKYISWVMVVGLVAILATFSLRATEPDLGVGITEEPPRLDKEISTPERDRLQPNKALVLCPGCPTEKLAEILEIVRDHGGSVAFFAPGEGAIIRLAETYHSSLEAVGDQVQVLGSHTQFEQVNQTTGEGVSAPSSLMRYWLRSKDPVERTEPLLENKDSLPPPDIIQPTESHNLDERLAKHAALEASARATAEGALDSASNFIDALFNSDIPRLTNLSANAEVVDSLPELVADASKATVDPDQLLLFVDSLSQEEVIVLLVNPRGNTTGKLRLKTVDNRWLVSEVLP